MKKNALKKKEGKEDCLKKGDDNMKQRCEPLGGRHLFQVRNRVFVQANDEGNEITSSPYALHPVSEVSSTLPLKQFQCLSD